MRLITTLLSIAMVLSIGSSCSKQAKSVGENPFFTEWTTPFGAPPFADIAPEHFMPAFERGISLQNAEIDAIVNNNEEPTFDNVILAYDASGQMLSQVSLVFGMLCAAETNDALQALQEQVMPILTAHSDAISLNEGLFAKIKTIYDKRKALNLDAEQMRLVEKIYNDFVRSGALLKDEDKARLESINEELALLSVKFGNNLLAENNDFKLVLTNKDLDGLSSSTRDAARAKAQEAGEGKNRFLFTLHKPSLLPFLTQSSRRDLREKLYKGYLERGANGDAKDNSQLIRDMVRLRIEKANLLGYKSYAEYVTADQMSGSPEAVYKQLNEIWDFALVAAQKELDEMNKLFVKDYPNEEFASWDWWYYAEKVRKEQYNLDEQMLQPYFSLANVQAGAFLLANRLFGVTFRPVNVPIYHKDVTAYEVIDIDGSHVGILYFDYFPRKGKSQGAWCGNYTEQIYKDGERRAPIISIVCNFTPPTSGTPALLTLDETETLFHEFGHALHFLFHDVKYRSLTDVEGDFVELPSQIMENWAFEPELLKQYATHHRTNEVIPQHLIDKLNRSSKFNQGFATTELIAAALTDMDVHTLTEYADFDPTAFQADALKKRGLMPQIEPRYRFPYFSHIFDGGYSSGYYFYIWAELLDKDAYEAFRESGDLFNREIANSFRHKILERGGSEAGMDMYRNFRGADPDKRAMLKGRGFWTEPSPADTTQNL